MRVNVYAEEMTDRVEIIEKEVEGNKFTALRFYLALPATYVKNDPDRISAMRPASASDTQEGVQYQAPFIHHPGDDDSAAVTFWGKTDLRIVLRKALAALDEHYANRGVHFTAHNTLKKSATGAQFAAAIKGLSPHQLGHLEQLGWELEPKPKSDDWHFAKYVKLPSPDAAGNTRRCQAVQGDNTWVYDLDRIRAPHQ